MDIYEVRMLNKRTFIKRVPGGKTLQIDIDCNDRINYILISGDFFAYPEDFIDKLQEAITGKSINEAIETISLLYKKMKPELLGISIDDIIDVLRKACA